MLGFDCEWVTTNGHKHPVGLLQLATHRGFCALIRLCRLRRIPAELRVSCFFSVIMFSAKYSLPNFKVLLNVQELLENDNILKVGVVPLTDANHLANDYGITVGSTLDLRFMARHFGHKPEGLAKMSLHHLNVTMDKDWRISCSDWDAETLSPRQIDYAAKDALVAVELFRHFVGHRYTKWFAKSVDETIELFTGQLDVGFSQHTSNM